MRTTKTEYADKNGKQIFMGMTLKHSDGEESLVYASDDDLGFNASNENHRSFCESSRQIYPLYQFDLTEYEIMDSYEITLVKETACLMMKNYDDLVGSVFFNQFEFKDMTTSDLIRESKELAERLHVKNYAININ